MRRGGREMKGLSSSLRDAALFPRMSVTESCLPDEEGRKEGEGGRRRRRRRRRRKKKKRRKNRWEESKRKVN